MRGAPCKPVRDRRDRAHVGGDVLALEAVAARRRLNEFAVLVAQAAGEPVDLGLGDHRQRRVRGHSEKAPHAGAKFLDLLIVEDVAERKHRHGVADLGELLRRRRADLAIGRVRVGELGEGGLERAVAAAKGVVIRRRKSSARPRRDSAGRARRFRRRGAHVRLAPWRGSWRGGKASGSSPKASAGRGASEGERSLRPRSLRTADPRPEN